MNILVLAPDIPATSRMPGSPRLFSLCRELARHHQLFLLTYRSSEQRYQAFLRDPAAENVFASMVILPDPPSVGWWGRQWHRIHCGLYFETRYRHPAYYRAIRAQIRDSCARERIDLIHADLLSMAQYVDKSLGLPIVADLTDSMTLLETRMLRSQRGIRSQLSSYLNLLRTKHLERSIGRSVDLVITNSVVDEAVFKDLSGSLNTLTITNGVDMQFFAPGEGAVNSERIVFTGVMGYAPNEDAAVYFAQECFPPIQAQQPKAEFWIVGADPSSRVQELAQRPGVHVTGEVEDVRPFLQSAAVVVCPLRVGAGVKNKILMAMAMQKAVVATPLSIEGLDVADNEEVVLADNPQVFAAKVVHLLTHPEEARRLGMNGWRRVHERYSWSAMGKTLETAMRSLAASRNGRPRQRAALS